MFGFLLLKDELPNARDLLLDLLLIAGREHEVEAVQFFRLGMLCPVRQHIRIESQNGPRAPMSEQNRNAEDVLAGYWRSRRWADGP